MSRTAKRALGLLLFVGAALATLLGDAWIVLAFYSDGCGPAYPGFIRFAILALSVAALCTVMGLQVLAGPSLKLLILAPVAVLLIAAWGGWLYAQVERTLPACFGTPAWWPVAGPGCLLILGALATALLSQPPGNRRGR